MPLKKLFQKRNSLKEVTAVKLANEEIDRLRSTVELTSNNEKLKVQAEPNASNFVKNMDSDDIKERSKVISSGGFSHERDFIHKEIKDSSLEGQNQIRRKSAPVEISNYSDEIKVRSSSFQEKFSLFKDGDEQLKTKAKQDPPFNFVEDMDNSDVREEVTSLICAKSEDFNSKYDYIQKEEFEDTSLENNSQKQVRRKSAPIEISKDSDKRKVRSTSYKEHRSKMDLLPGARRKCVSESSDSSTEKEIQEKAVIQLPSKELEMAIEQYVSRLISESIVTAVRSVNVENICHEIVENFSNRSNSSSSQANMYYERKWSESLAEYVELEDSPVDTEIQEDFSVDDTKFKDFSVKEKSCVEVSSSDGYQADLDELESLHSIDSEAKLNVAVDNSAAKSHNLDESNTNMKISSESNLKLDNSQDFKTISELSGSENNAPSSYCVREGSEMHVEESRISKEVFYENKEQNLYQNVLLSSKHPEIKMADEIDSTKEKSQNETDTVITDTKSVEGVCEASENSLILFQNDSQIPEKGKITDPVSNDEAPDLVENLPQKQKLYDEEKKVNWKMGYLHVKLPHKTRGKGHLKAWKKRCVSIQPDEFANDPKCPSLMISVYSSESGTARKHSASFWKSISCQKAVVYRSSSRTHKYAFTISDDSQVVIHLAADCETTAQEWMAAIRAILWPPSPVMQLEKMLNGREFEISVIDNDFAYRAGLLGMYGYLTVTRKKLILVHPQQGYVIQEWYLNTIDKFELMPPSKVEDAHKILAMTTCSDSSTGKGELLMYCTEAIALLQSIASTIHQILTDHSVQAGGKYEKELAEMADWLVPVSSQDNADQNSEEYYKVPPRQVKSLLDIPNFIFDKSLSPVASVSCRDGEDMESVKSLVTSKTNITRASQDSGISAGNISEDFLNCSMTSFVVGGGAYPGKSSDSELSDSYTPPRTPDVESKKRILEREENISVTSA